MPATGGKNARENSEKGFINFLTRIQPAFLIMRAGHRGIALPVIKVIN